MATGTMTDAAIMAYCLELAERGRGWTSPNPVVGAALVRENAILAAGWHKKYGGLHAEVEALAAFPGRVPSDAILYVTLEPCCHRGRGKKTPPCTELILQRGVKRVVVGTLDPNPRVAGRGVARLRRRGVRVTVGVMARECREANRWFAKHIRTGLPYGIVKAGLSLDAKLAARAGQPGWVTGPASRAHSHGLRAAVDAILIGSGTARSDNPRLTARDARGVHQPLRVVLDRTGTLPPTLRLFRDGAAPTLRVVAPGVRVPRRRGVEVMTCPATDGGFDLASLMRRLGARGVTSVLLEGGSRTHAAFLAAGLVDEAALYFAPRLLGSRALGWPFPAAGAAVPPLRFRRWAVEKLPDGFLFTGRK